MKKLGFGFMRLPLTDPDSPTAIDMPQLQKMVDAYLEQGFTYFDTAYPYHNGRSEVALRETLVKRYPRDAYILADKLPMFVLSTDKEEQERIFQEQIERCGVDYFDNYLIHNLGPDSYKKALNLDTFEFVAQKKREGKARRIGFSYHHNAELLDEILTAHPEMEFVQLQINYMDWDNDSIQSRLCHEVARKHGKPVIVMEPVKGGTLATVPEKAQALFKQHAPEASVPSWAIRFAASLEGVPVVLSGMSSLEQLRDNMSYMQDFQPLSDEEHAVVRQAADIIAESIAIPCTACQYCVEDCPQNIAIPKYFALYNNEKQSLPAAWSVQRQYYTRYIETYGKASDCIGCRACERHCPQQLPVVEHLRAVADNFEAPLE